MWMLMGLPPFSQLRRGEVTVTTIARNWHSSPLAMSRFPCVTYASNTRRSLLRPIIPDPRLASLPNRYRATLTGVDLGKAMNQLEALTHPCDLMRGTPSPPTTLRVMRNGSPRLKDTQHGHRRRSVSGDPSPPVGGPVPPGGARYA